MAWAFFDYGVQPHEVETHDGGKTWSSKNFTGYLMGLNITAIPYTHTFVSTIVYGYTPVAGCSYSNDYGATWNLIDSSSQFDHTKAAFLNPFIGWCGRADSQDPDPSGGMYKWKYKFSLDDDAIADGANTNNIIASKDNTTSLSAYPNPVSSSTNISFSLAQSQQVSLQIFDMSGRLIKKLANEIMTAGNHQLIWNVTDNNESAVSSGIYLLKLERGNTTETKKISVIH